MKKILNSLKDRMNHLVVALHAKAQLTRRKLAETSGQFAVEHTVTFIIIIVIAGICIAALSIYVKDTMAPKLESKIDGLFS